MMTEAMDPDIQATNGVFLRAEQITKVFPGTVALNGVKLPAHRAGLLKDLDQNSSNCWADFSCSW